MHTAAAVAHFNDLMKNVFAFLSQYSSSHDHLSLFINANVEKAMLKKNIKNFFYIPNESKHKNITNIVD